MKLYSRGSARKSLIDTAAFRVISQISTMLGYVVLVRGMTESSLGVLSLLYAFIPVVSTVASLGLDPVLRRYQPEYLQTGNKVAAAWLVRVVSTGRFISNVVVLGVILLLWNHIAPIFKLTADHRTMFAAVSVLMLLNFQTSLLQAALGSHMLHRYSVGSTAVLSLVKLVLYGVFYLYGGLSLETAIFIDTLAYAVAYVSMRVVYRRLCLTPDARGSYKPNALERKRLIRYALFNNFNDAGVLLMYVTLDSFFLAAFIGPTAVGIYVFYTKLKQMVYSVLPALLFDNVVRPLLFAVPPLEADRKMPTYFSFLVNMNLLVQWPALALSLAYHAEIVQVIFAGRFIEYSWLLPTIMAFATASTLIEPAALIAQYEERAGMILLSKLFAIYNLLAMAALVPLWGVYGAAIAAGTAQIMKNTFIWWHVRHRAVWTNWRAALVRGAVIWGAGVAVCIGIKAVVDLPPAAYLVAGVVVFGIVGLLHVRSAALSPLDRAILAGVTSGYPARVLHYVGLLPRAA